MHTDLPQIPLADCAPLALYSFYFILRTMGYTHGCWWLPLWGSFTYVKQRQWN